MSDTRPNRQLHPETRAAQALRHIDPMHGGVTPAIELSATFARDADYAPRQDYIYGRDGGPTVVHAEDLIRDLEGAAATLTFASGLSAFTTLMETLPPGAHVAAPEVMYHGGLTWLRRLAETGRLSVTFYDQADAQAMAAAVAPGTALLWVETPANPTWDVVDIAAAAGIAHAAGARLAVDGTAAPPCATRALALGADIAFHSATKYLSGHSDVTAGVLSLATDDLLADLREVRYLTGTTLSPFPAWLLIRGMRTLFLRWERACENALAIATALSDHPKVAAVLYPGLPDHPGHAVARAQMTGGFGGMLSILTEAGAEAANAVARNCRVFIPATSLGGVESLIEHRKAVEPPYSKVPDTLLRLSTGIEAAADLIADLEQALDRS